MSVSADLAPIRKIVRTPVYDIFANDLLSVIPREYAGKNSVLIESSTSSKYILSCEGKIFGTLVVLESESFPYFKLNFTELGGVVPKVESQEEIIDKYRDQRV
jgi:hypothetical protein